MSIDSPYFSIEELVCQDVYNKFGKYSLKFFDQRLLITLDTLRDRIGRPIRVNNWKEGGKFSQRGLRCNLCDLVKSKTELYMSAHVLGKAVDFDIDGMLAEETREWIIKKANWWPYSIRLEKDVNWVHLDVMTTPTQKVILF